MECCSFSHFKLLVLYSVIKAYSSVNDELLTSVGDTAQLFCAPNVTKTSIVIIWQHNDDSILDHDLRFTQDSSDRFTSRVTEVKSTVALEISNVSLDDAGNYSCIWFLKSGVPQKKQMTLKVQGYPSLTLHSNTIFEGDFLEAKCCVQLSHPSVDGEIGWLLENRPDLFNTPLSSGIITSTEEGNICSNFRVHTSRDYNNKTLQCYIKNKLNLSAAITLHIIYPATVEILGKLEDSTLLTELHSALNITCVADGNPTPNITLEKEESPDSWEKAIFTTKEVIKDGNTKVSSFLSATVTADCKGYYRCCADNMRGVDASCVRFYVDITIPSKIQMLMPPSIKIEDGEELVISCQTEGNPETEVQLQRNAPQNSWSSLSTKPIPIFKQDMVSTWMFRLDDQLMDLTGRYRCVGYNGVGDHAISEEVVVEGKSGLTASEDNATIPSPLPVIAVICTVLITALIIAVVVSMLLSRRKCFTRSRAGRSLPLAPKDVQITHGYEENLELYNIISDDNEGCIAKHINFFTKNDVKFVSKLKSGRHMERWLGLLKKTASFSNDKNVCVLFLPGNEKTMLTSWSRHLHFVVKLPRHENIVTTLGTFEDNGIAYCIQEYLPFGNLRTYLESEYGQSYIYGNTVEPIPQEFVSFALDVIRGMEFLRYHGWIHPGLCAHKVMLDYQRKHCKLYDICHICNRTEKVKLILEKTQTDLLHIAPEIISRDEYSYRSDVWAVGVLLWEIFSYGASVPAKDGNKYHADIQNKLTKPSNCPRQLYDVMTQCWVFDPMSRPTFIDLEERLKSTAETYQMTIFETDQQKNPAESEQETYAREIHSS